MCWVMLDWSLIENSGSGLMPRRLCARLRAWDEATGDETFLKMGGDVAMGYVRVDNS